MESCPDLLIFSFPLPISYRHATDLLYCLLSTILLEIFKNRANCLFKEDLKRKLIICEKESVTCKHFCD